MCYSTEVSVAQVLEGTRLAPPGRCHCTRCKRALHDGHPVTAYACQPVDGDRWTVPRVYCLECEREQVRTPTLGIHEVVVRGWLGVVSLAAAQAHRLVVTDVEVLDGSPPGKGSRG